MKVIVYDIETYKKLSLFCFYNIDTQEKKSFEISRRKNEMDGLIKYLVDRKYDYLCGFNSCGFDFQVIQYILDYYEHWNEQDYTSDDIIRKIYDFSQELIDNQKYENVKLPYNDKYFEIPQIDLFMILHMDNKNRRTSLKWCEFSMDIDIEELPIDFRKDYLEDEEIESVIQYCWVDVQATHQLYNFVRGKTDHEDYKDKDKIQLRLDLINEYELPSTAINWNDVKIGAELNKLNYRRIAGVTEKQLWKKIKERKSRTGFKFRDCFPEYMKFETKEFQEFFTLVGETTVNLNAKQEFPFIHKGVKYTYAKGGLHTTEKNRITQPAVEELLLSADVGSMYPNIIRKRELYPAHLGKSWNEAYISNIPKRLEAKRLYKETKEKKYDNFQECFKLVMNGCFGRLIDRYDWQYDAFCGMNVTIAGQIDLFMLIEQLSIKGIRIISANTDGLECIVKENQVQEYYQICKSWEKQVGNDILGQLEYVEYEKFVQTSVNDYIAIKKADWKEIEGKFTAVPIDKSLTYKDKVKKKGSFLTSYELHKNKSCRIVPIALEKYFTLGIPVEETIRNHRNIFDFTIAKKASKDYFYKQVDRTTGTVVQLNKLVRYYCSVPKDKIVIQDSEDEQEIIPGKLYKIKRENSEARGPKVSKCESASAQQVLFNKPFKVDKWSDYAIDESWYVEKAAEIISDIDPVYKRDRLIKKSGAILLF